MHVCVSAECGQATPPAVGCTFVRLRFCEPVPHDLVQVDQAIQDPTPQSAAHTWVLHARVSAECGHAAPPLEGSTVARLRLCEPVPHDFEHVDQRAKLFTTQLTGHACSLHWRASLSCGQALPP